MDCSQYVKTHMQAVCVVCALQPGLQYVLIHPHALKRNLSSVKWLEIDSRCKEVHISVSLYITYFLFLYFILLSFSFLFKYCNLSDIASENDESWEQSRIDMAYILDCLMPTNSLWQCYFKYHSNDSLSACDCTCCYCPQWW